MPKEKVMSLAEAFKKKGLDPKKLPIVDHLPVEHQKAQIAFYKLSVYISAVNGDWIPDFTDMDQEKWYIWPWVKADKKRPSGFGFAGTLYGYVVTDARVGARLYYRSYELAKASFNRKEIKQLYIDYLLMPN